MKCLIGRSYSVASLFAAVGLLSIAPSPLAKDQGADRSNLVVNRSFSQEFRGFVNEGGGLVRAYKFRSRRRKLGRTALRLSRPWEHVLCPPNGLLTKDRDRKSVV